MQLDIIPDCTYTVEHKVEDRVIANLSRDKNKCAIFLDGVDGHCLNSYYYWKNEIEAILPRKPDEEEFHYIKRYKEAVDNGNKQLKAIRQMGKPVTFGLSYGAYPKKVAQSAKLPIEKAQEIFNNYHNFLYPEINDMRSNVLTTAKKFGKLHLGLGCVINTDNPEAEIRTIFNACSQFWSIITLLTINKLHMLIDSYKLNNRMFIVSTIYDSIYILLEENPALIKWLNKTIIPILTTDYLKDIIIHNEAVGSIGYNWYDLVDIPNNADIACIKQSIADAKDLYLKNS